MKSGFGHIACTVFVVPLILAMPVRGGGRNHGYSSRAQKEAGLLLRLHLEQRRVSPGDRIILKVSLKNGSPIGCDVVVTNDDRDYLLRIVRYDGDDVQTTPYGRDLAEGATDTGPRHVETLSPGQQLQGSLDPGKIFDLSRRGVYYISARRPVTMAGQEGFSWIDSNTVRLEVN